MKENKENKAEEEGKKEEETEEELKLRKYITMIRVGKDDCNCFEEKMWVEKMKEKMRSENNRLEEKEDGDTNTKEEETDQILLQP